MKESIIFLVDMQSFYASVEKATAGQAYQRARKIGGHHK
jgi:nucleotidyltransferase/DNA polymerase involved in DNA repair